MRFQSFVSQSVLRRSPYTAELFKAMADGEHAIEAVSSTCNVSTNNVASLHDPPLEPRDEAVFLLNVVAEVEHALLVQYLYAAYSVRADGTVPRGEYFQNVLLQIAREEMGHLATVQNLLHVLGGPLNFHREQSPYSSALYPFRFRLQPLTLRSLAKYVIAESPSPPPADLPEADKTLLCDRIEPEAKADNGGIAVQHVGPFFARLLDLFRDDQNGIRDEDLLTNTAGQHAKYEDWGYDPEKSLPMAERLIVQSIDGETAEVVRRQAVEALEAIAEQGEGHDPGPTGTESHFERFFMLYKDLDSATSGGTKSVTWPIPTNPNTSIEPPHQAGMEKMVDMVLESHAKSGRITDGRSRAWAQLFNLRYRLLLQFLSHFLQSDGKSYRSEQASLGDRTERGLLLIWTFHEMRRLRKVALKLVQMPKDDSSGLNAAAPFELPYTLNLPVAETARWRTHLDASRASSKLASLIQSEYEDGEDAFLDDLVRLDEVDQQIMAALATGDGIPAGALPTEFQKVASILEESVRGFDIGSVFFVHGNFWDRKNRDDFISGPPGSPNIRANTQGGFDPDRSSLVRRIEGTTGNQMPRFRPAIPPERLKYVRDWIEAGCPHNGELSMERERQPHAEPTGPPPEPPTELLTFEEHIKPLFREDPDRRVMRVFGMDLHSHQDVSARADAILARLSDGSMPCDGPWPPDRIALFEKWIEDGKRP